MSHIATVELVVKDLDALAKAAKRCGLEFRTGQQTYKWYENQANVCNHALSVPGNENAYEIGVVKNADGKTYKLEYDTFNRGYGLMDRVSADSDKYKKGVGKLMQAYGIEVARKQAIKQGFRVREKLDASGTVRLVFSR